MAITSIEENLKDKIFFCSYGTNKTIPEFCKIVRDFGMTVMAVLLTKKIVSGDYSNGTVIPTDEKISMGFKLRKKQYNDGEIYLKGKFPEHSASEIWLEWDGTPQLEYKKG